MFILKFAGRSHVLDDESGQRARAALENGAAFVTVSIDFSGCGEAVYPVTINTAHVHSLIERRSPQSEPRFGATNIFELANRVGAKAPD